MFSKITQVGFEWEFMLWNQKSKKYIFPASVGFGHGDMPLLGEVRALPGQSPAEATGLFIQSVCETRDRVMKLKHLELQCGYALITPEQYAEAMLHNRDKPIERNRNVYGTDILQLTDDVTENNVRIGTHISSGLHIHLSQTEKYARRVNETTIEDIRPLLTITQMSRLVKQLDKKLLPKYPTRAASWLAVSSTAMPVNLKYRQPGFWDIKAHGGFEYRSLPMLTDMFNVDTIHDISKVCFNLLHKL